MAGLVCAGLLLAALLLPLAFRQSAASGGGTGASPVGEAERKAALFRAYWYGDEAADGSGGAAGSGGAQDAGQEQQPSAPAVLLGAEKAEPDEVVSAFCEEVMARLTARWIDDRALEMPRPTGREFTTLRGRNGSRLTLCRMWLEAQGDWRNWMDVCFDADTGTVYYLYLSRECLTNLGRYTAGTPRPDAHAAAEELAGLAGGRLRHFAGSTAVVECPDGVLCYDIGQVNYDALIDLRINCV